MAKKVAKKVTKKRVKKNVERGQAHIQSSFNNTIVTLQTLKAMLYHGQVPVVLDLEVQENLLLMLHRWQLRLLQKQRSFMVLKK